MFTNDLFDVVDTMISSSNAAYESAFLAYFLSSCSLINSLVYFST